MFDSCCVHFWFSFTIISGHHLGGWRGGILIQFQQDYDVFAKKTLIANDH